MKITCCNYSRTEVSRAIHLSEDRRLWRRDEGTRKADATGGLAFVQGSSELTMDYFDTASKVIYEQISPDANVIVSGQSAQEDMHTGCRRN